MMSVVAIVASVFSNSNDTRSSRSDAFRLARGPTLRPQPFRAIMGSYGEMPDMLRHSFRFDFALTPFQHALAAVDESGALAHLTFYGRAARLRTRLEAMRAVRDEEACGDVWRQLDEYFDGKRRAFALRLAPVGSPFQLHVWKALQSIPYGETASYLDLSRQLGSGTPRDVG